MRTYKIQLFIETNVEAESEDEAILTFMKEVQDSGDLQNYIIVVDDEEGEKHDTHQ